jgi:tripeptide aminopeptidase
VKGNRIGTSNVGPVMGADGGPAGQATNVVTDYVKVKGESRSHDAKFFKAITAAYKQAFTDAAQDVKNSEGKAGKVKFTAQTDYYPFRLKENLPVVKRAMEAGNVAGLAPEIRVASGGLDANWLVRHGIPTVTFGAGQVDPHTVDEWVDLEQFDNACTLAFTLATMQ